MYQIFHYIKGSNMEVWKKSAEHAISLNKRFEFISYNQYSVSHVYQIKGVHLESH